MTAFVQACETFEALPPSQVFGWSLVVLVVLAVTSHFKAWGRE